MHPGIGLTEELLRTARANIIAHKEPWYSGFKELAMHPQSVKWVKCRNQSWKNPGQPDLDAFNSKSMEMRISQDSGKAERQALMYFFTGDETYRANAMNILRVWSKMAPNKYGRYPDCNIHSGYPLRAMVRAAEIMRYTSCENPKLAWTEQDTAQLTQNLVDPMISTFMNYNGWFMNQNDFALLGAMSGYIFTNNREGYNQRVEWFTVNSTAPNQGWSGSIKQLARLVDTNAKTGEKLEKPVVQLVEMGRDQAHGAEDVNLFVNISNMMMAQRTKVDPVDGTVSTRPNAVGPYEFLNDRILAAADSFCRYMLGYGTPWVPVAHNISPQGEVRGIYPRLSDQYRGRMTTFGFWHLYFYYAYVRKVKVAQAAPYLYEAYAKRISNLDWLSLPAAAAAEGASLVLEPSQPDTVEVARRYTAQGGKIGIAKEGKDRFVRVVCGREGAKLAVLSAATSSKTIGLRVRTTGTARVDMPGFAQPWLLPNTQGQWKQVSYSMGEFEQLDNLVYLLVKASPETTVDFDKLLLKPAPSLTAPAFKQGGPSMITVAYPGAPIKFDFSATVAGTSDSVTYHCADLPPGANLNRTTGAFSWRPAKEGNYSFMIEAANQERIAPKLVTIDVAPDRASAVKKAAAAFDSHAEYVKSTLDQYKRGAQQAEIGLRAANGDNFYAQLLRLQEAVGGLKLLTPRLADGSMDFTRCAVSPELGKAIWCLADGNNDTFPVYTLARGRNYTFDFGPNFKFSAEGFAMQGRLNFEDRMAGTVFFGSDDAKAWTRLTPATTQYSVRFSKVEVARSLRNSRFRYLRIQKTWKGLFEPSELRIYGQRHESGTLP
jgi:hypothetical protein